MEHIQIISKRSFFFLALSFYLNCCAQKSNQKSDISSDSIYGQWTYVKHGWWQASKFGKEEVENIKLSILNVEKNRVYFANLKFIDTCKYSQIEYRNFFEEGKEKSSYSEDYQYMMLKYPKAELSKIQRVKLNCEYNCLGELYLKQDTLILNFCGGVTFYMIKTPDKTKLNIDGMPIVGDTVRCKYQETGEECTGYIIQGTRKKGGKVVHVNPANKNVPLEIEEIDNNMK